VDSGIPTTNDPPGKPSCITTLLAEITGKLYHLSSPSSLSLFSRLLVRRMQLSVLGF
jgi:hypothetical protein